MPDSPDMQPSGVCRALNKHGAPCGFPPMTGEEWCFRHHPERAEARRAASVLGGTRRKKPPRQGPPSKLRTMDDVLHELESALDDAKALQMGVGRIKAQVAAISAAIAAQTNAVRIAELTGRLGGVNLSLEEALRRAGADGLPEADWEIADDPPALLPVRQRDPAPDED